MFSPPIQISKLTSKSGGEATCPNRLCPYLLSHYFFCLEAHQETRLLKVKVSPAFHYEFRNFYIHSSFEKGWWLAPPVKGFE